MDYYVPLSAFNNKHYYVPLSAFNNKHGIRPQNVENIFLPVEVLIDSELRKTRLWWQAYLMGPVTYYFDLRKDSHSRPKWHERHVPYFTIKLKCKNFE